MLRAVLASSPVRVPPKQMSSTRRELLRPRLRQSPVRRRPSRPGLLRATQPQIQPPPWPVSSVLKRPVVAAPQTPPRFHPCPPGRCRRSQARVALWWEIPRFDRPRMPRFDPRSSRARGRAAHARRVRRGTKHLPIRSVTQHPPLRSGTPHPPLRWRRRLRSAGAPPSPALPGAAEAVCSASRTHQPSPVRTRARTLRAWPPRPPPPRRPRSQVRAARSRWCGPTPSGRSSLDQHRRRAARIVPRGRREWRRPPGHPSAKEIVRPLRRLRPATTIR